MAENLSKVMNAHNRTGITVPPGQSNGSSIPAGQVAGGERKGTNLLNFRPLAAFVRWSGFPALFKGLVLAVLIGLAIIGWGQYTPQGVNAKLYAKTNLVNLVIWGLWWPAIIFVTFWLGRVWCIVCPLELVSARAEFLSRKMGFSQRSLPGWMVKGSLVVLLFAILQMLVPGVQLHRVPHYTSLFLWILLGSAFAVGLYFRDRAFCRGFCPVALLLSAYGRGGMIAVRPGDQKKLVYSPASNNTPTRLSCRSLLNPARLNSSKDCLLCCDCIKADTTGSMQLLLQPPFSKADTRELLASWPMTLFVMIVSGFVTYELCGVWKEAESVFLWIPQRLTAAINAAEASGWIQGLWTIFVIPLLLWSVIGGLTLLTGGARSLSEAWRMLALPMALVVASGHMAKGLEKFTSWAGFLPYALAEPSGARTVIKINTKLLPQPTAWFDPPTLSVLAMLLLAIGTILAVREGRLCNPAKTNSNIGAILLLGGFYFFLVFGWGGWWE